MKNEKGLVEWNLAIPILSEAFCTSNVSFVYISNNNTFFWVLFVRSMTCRKLGKTHQTYEQTLYLEMASSLWNACCQPSSCQTSLAFLKMLVTTHPSKNVALLSMWPDNDSLCMKNISLSKLAHSIVHTSMIPFWGHITNLDQNKG